MRRVLGLGYHRLLPGIGQRLADLAVVPVDSQRLEAQLPAFDIDLLYIFYRCRFRKIDRLADGPTQAWLDGGHHPDVAHRADRALTHRAVEDLIVLLPKAWGIHDMPVLSDVFDDRLDLLRLVAHGLQGTRHGLVDDLHGTATDELLELGQRQIRLDPSGVAIHHEAYGASWGQQATLGVSVPICLTQLEAFPPGFVGRSDDRHVHAAERPDFVAGGCVLTHHPLVGRCVALVALVRADYSCQFR